ncbi:MAG: Endoribonuclease L-PSP [Pelotomaculum sp. PtaB.Bin104]|nr:MAG: Endoribonuclease L-PSP [Pelotomaculum sp. PtaB.Bin104]
MSFEEKLMKLGIHIPDAPRPVAAYIPAVLAGSFVYASGQLPVADGQLKFAGKLDRDLTTTEGYQAARLCAINCLAAIKGVIGSLDNIVRVVKVTGFVNSTAGFTQQPQVINGASELIGDIFGEMGKHARSAVGVSDLPLNAAEEVEIIVEARPC